LIEWMREQMAPHYINAEDLDILRIVDRPEDAVALVVESQRKLWWSPGDKVLAAEAEAGERQHGNETPMASGGWTRKTGEGTRYGVRPRRAAERTRPGPKPGK
jgi:hypothetical protein